MCAALCNLIVVNKDVCMMHLVLRNFLPPQLELLGLIASMDSVFLIE